MEINLSLCLGPLINELSDGEAGKEGAGMGAESIRKVRSSLALSNGILRPN